MAYDFDALPEPVREALRSGRHADAARLLREAKGISLKAAKGHIEAALVKGLPAAQQQGPGSGRPSRGAIEPVRGQHVGVVRLLQALRGVSLNQANEEAAAAAQRRSDPLAPGEQPNSGGAVFVAWLLAALLAVASFLIFRRL